MNDRDLLLAAQGGDEQAFVALTAPHRSALHAHAYRMLGSLHDADDAVQETMLRAWRALPRYEPRAPLRAWLHRILMNVALRMVERRPPQDGVPHLQPYPDALLAGIPDDVPSPEAEAISRESLGLAYIAAMQVLAPKQRAVLVLRDALGWSARETAELLDDTPAAVNSALQRARARLARERDAGVVARLHAPAGEGAERQVMAAFLDAWAAVDIPRIIALLSEDAVLTMPPMGLRFEGADAVGAFFATEPAGGRLERIAHVECRANGQPTLASYLEGADAGDHDAYGVMVFAIHRDRIAGITGFPHDLETFRRLGLPAVLSRP